MQARNRFLALTVALAASAALVGCAQPMGSYGGSSYPVGNSGGGYQGAYSEFGRVVDVRFMQGGDSSRVVGTLAGGAIGGLAGNQIGKGSGRTAATIAGAVGGALVGRAIEGNMAGSGGSNFYRVTVQLDSGATRSFDYAQPPGINIGDRVRVEGNQLYR